MTVITGLNPYEDSTPWGVVEIAGVRVAGVVESIDGAEKPEDWDIQKPTKKSGATTVWKGTKLAESIKIVVALPNAKAFAGYTEMRDILRPKLGTKPPTHQIVNPAINFNGITRISVRNIGMPKWVVPGGFWRGEITILEYNPPKPTNTGVAGNVTEITKKKPDPNADLNNQIREKTEELNQLRGGGA